MHLFAQAAAVPVNLWPLAILAISILLIVLLIAKWRVHPFLALILAAIAVGLLAEKLPNARPRASSATTEASNADPQKLRSHWVAAVELTTESFGKTAGNIAVVIGLASIIGMCLMESGAADKVVRRFLAVFGEKRASFALLTSTYFLSIPIFFDTMFMLMIPLAKALRLRTGKDYVLYILAICSGGVVTHSLTVPHPGPLAMVDNLKVDVGLSILCGIGLGIVPAVAGWVAALWINSRLTVPLRETADAPLADLEAIVAKPEAELPPFWLSILPVILPIVLISGASLMEVAAASIPALVGWLGGPERFAALQVWVEFIGNRNIALFIGAAISIGILARQCRCSFKEIERRVGPPLMTAGIIILITSAGGAFGYMLRAAGVGDAIKDIATGYHINLILLSWVVAFVIRIAQGSATVAMLTTSAMIYPMIDPTVAGAVPLAFHPMYIFMAIGFGALTSSWMNDSGFWVVNRLSGMTEGETLKSWTVMLTVISIVGFLFTLLLSAVFPFAPTAPAVGL